jgi:hypothetical protein
MSAVGGSVEPQTRADMKLGRFHDAKYDVYRRLTGEQQKYRALMDKALDFGD